jgi:tRNA nucleotidyltransferase (CCA-adding enzyme)
MGRHLLELGLEPGPGFRPILDECFERQIDGEFETLEGGVTCARSIVARGRQRPD